MNLDHDFVQVSKLSEDYKKKIFTKNGTLFSSEFKWTPTLRCTPESLNYWGDADVHHTVLKLLGGIQPNYWGKCIPPFPPGFGTPVGNERLLVAYCYPTVFLRANQTESYGSNAVDVLL